MNNPNDCLTYRLRLFALWTLSAFLILQMASLVSVFVFDGPVFLGFGDKALIQLPTGDIEQ